MNFPKHECGLYLTHNEHKDYYQSAKEFIEEQDGQECAPLWQSLEAKERAIATNELWELQWYPNTPIGSYRVCAPTLEELLAFANCGDFK